MKHIRENDQSFQRTLYISFVALVSLIVGFLSYQAKNFRLDDALIYARYIFNALHRHGLVYNPGQRVNALTSPLFTYIVLATSSLLRNVIFAEYLICGLALALAIAVTASQMRLLIGKTPAYITGLIIAGSMYFYTVIGMETSLFLLMLGLCFLAFKQANHYLLGIILVLTLLTRPEGGLMVPILFLEHRRLKRTPPPLQALIAPALLFLAYLAFNVSYYGRVLPDSATAKFGQGSSGIWGRWPTAFLRFNNYPVFDWTWGGQYYVLIFMTIFGLIGCWSLRTTSWGRIYFAFCASLLLFYVLFNIPAYHWYYGPFFFFGFWFMAAGLMHIVSATRYTKLAYAVMLIIFANSILHASRRLPWGNVSKLPYYAAAEWLRTNTPKDATVACAETGVIGWYSERPIIDMVGLTTPANARLISRGQPTDWLHLDKPDYVIVHYPAWIWERPVLAGGNYQRMFSVQADEVPEGDVMAYASSAAPVLPAGRTLCVGCVLRHSQSLNKISLFDLLFSDDVQVTLHQPIPKRTIDAVSLFGRTK